MLRDAHTGCSDHPAPGHGVLSWAGRSLEAQSLNTAQSLWVCTVEPFPRVRAVAQLQALLSRVSVYSEVVPEKQELGVADHRTVQAGRDFSRFSRSIPLLKQGQIQQVGQDFV